MRTITVTGWIFDEPKMEKTKKGNDVLHFKMTSWQSGDPMTADGKKKSMFIQVSCYDSNLFALFNNSLIKKNKHITLMGDFTGISPYIAKDGKPDASITVRARGIYLDDYNGESKNNEQNNASAGYNPQVQAYAPQQQVAQPQMTQQAYAAQPQMAQAQMPQQAYAPQQQYAPQAQPQQAYAAQPQAQTYAPQQMAQPQIPQVQGYGQPQMQPQGYNPQQQVGEPLSPTTANTLEQLKQMYPEINNNAAASDGGDLPF